MSTHVLPIRNTMEKWRGAIYLIHDKPPPTQHLYSTPYFIISHVCCATVGRTSGLVLTFVLQTETVYVRMCMNKYANEYVWRKAST